MPGRNSNAPVRSILALAWPILVGQWAAMSFGVIDSVMTGHAASAELAALALGAAVYGTVLLTLMGVVLALNPILARHLGAGRAPAVGAAFVQGLWVALALAGLGDLVLAFPDAWLVASPVSPEVRSRFGEYLHALMFALPAALVFRAVYALHTAVARPRVVMLINLVAVALKLPLNYALVFGHWGAPRLGAAGCGVATALVVWISCAVAFAVLATDRFYAPFGLRAAWPRWSIIRDILRLGIPMGLSYAVEVTSFSFMSLLASRLGTTVTAGHQIIANLAGVCYGVSFALAVATGTLTAQALGAAQPERAERIIREGGRLALAAAALLGLLVFLGRHFIVGLYTSDPAVATVAVSLAGLFVFFHVSDALQTLAVAALRAYRRALAPLVVYAALLWGLGLYGGYLLAFEPLFGWGDQGIAGLWLAATAALMLAALVLCLRLAVVARQGTRTLTLSGSAAGST